MSTLQRTPMRRCGRRYPTEADALHSKRALAGGVFAARCLLPGCGGWHLWAVVAGPVQRKRSAPKGARPFPPDVAAALDERDRCCQRCAGTESLERHHRRLKGIGGSRGRHAQCACNGVVLCRSCHRWVHDNPREAEAQGFIVSQSVDEPGSVSVMRFAAAGGGASQYPACDGQWVSTPAELREVA